DQLSISQAGVKASQQIANNTAKSNSTQNYKNIDEAEQNYLISSGACSDYLELVKNSKHMNLAAWSIGLDTNRDYSLCAFRTDPRDVRNKVILEQKKLDVMVSDKLKAAGIELEKKETLNFSVNQDGVIKVDAKGIFSENKRTDLERVLNGDKELAYQLQYIHAIQSMQAMDENDTPNSAYRILIDNILRNEYGVSVDDFGYKKIYDEENRPKEFTFNGDMPDSIEQIKSEELNLYSTLMTVVAQQKLDFEYDFSYRNGIVLTKDYSDMSFIRKNINNYVDYVNPFCDMSFTLDGNGEYIDSSVTQIYDDPKRVLLAPKYQGAEQQFNEFFKHAALSNEDDNTAQFTVGQLGKISSEVKRLFQFEFGEDAESMDDFNIMVDRKFGKSTDIRLVGVKSGVLDGTTTENTYSRDLKDNGNTKVEQWGLNLLESNLQNEPSLKFMTPNLLNQAQGKKISVYSISI
ncbi:MAG: hypothetical protein ACRC2T_07315, partial [Thermoguttaceae bacterium]